MTFGAQANGYFLDSNILPVELLVVTVVTVSRNSIRELQEQKPIIPRARLRDLSGLEPASTCVPS
jgi:hypothetical protein